MWNTYLARMYLMIDYEHIQG